LSLNGFLIVDKPKGMTSHDVVNRVRRITGQRKAGHTGTLDPNATGVLVIALGEATKLIPYLENDDKSYRAEILFGTETDSCDITGTPVKELDSFSLDETQLDKVLPQFTGEIMQTPPVYSALKVNGRKLYEYARAGQQVEIKARPVTIYAIRTAADNLPLKVTLDVDCSKGTYIRSLARDIGESLGIPACLGELRRTRAGAFDEDAAVTLDALENGSLDAENLLVSGSSALSGIPEVRVSHEGERFLKNGNLLRGQWLADIPDNAEEGDPVRIRIEGNTGMAGIGKIGRDQSGNPAVQPVRVFQEGI
jgi:tRNA pseudouridine55 synthase